MWEKKMTCTKQEMIELLKKRMSYSEISEALGVSKSTVQRWVIAWDIKKYWNPISMGRYPQKRPVVKPVFVPAVVAEPKVIDCKTCVHRDTDQNLGVGIHCGYCMDTGHLRRCSPEGCLRYEKGNPKRRKQIRVI